MYARSFAKPCADVLAKRISLDVFFRKTSPVWRAMAKQLSRKWKSSLVREEDTYQNICLAVCVIVASGRYDASRANPADYLVFNALDKAKKKLHKARGAKLSGNADSNPSREPLLVEEREGEEPISERVSSQNDDPSEAVEISSEIKQILESRCENEFQRIAFLMLFQTRDFDLTTAEILKQSGAFRAEHRISSHDGTLEKVKRELSKIAKKAA